MARYENVKACLVFSLDAYIRMATDIGLREMDASRDGNQGLLWICAKWLL
jgi:hypothetical protein